jgi:23S rRNA pseudouridine1911/1915/1917 synthase
VNIRAKGRSQAPVNDLRASRPDARSGPGSTRLPDAPPGGAASEANARTHYNVAPAEPGGGHHRLQAPASTAGRRLDQVLADLLPEHSRTRLRGWIEAGLVRVDGGVVTSPRHKLDGGEAIAVEEGSAGAPSHAVAQDIALRIVHEDEALIVVDKPAGLVVHPGSGNPDGTLQNALLHHAPAVAILPRAGIVHRLDKDTSGLLVVAKNAQAQTDLVRQLAARTVAREYVAVVHGDVARGMTIDAPIGRHPTQRTSMAVVERGKPARTHVEVAERLGDATVVRCRLETGRTHQIRVHLAAAGHPLIGDPTYRARHKLRVDAIEEVRAFPRQALHAHRLGLVHPVSHRAMRWQSPIPADIRSLIAALRAHG